MFKVFNSQYLLVFFSLLAILSVGCKDVQEENNVATTFFDQLTTQQTGINFRNEVVQSEQMNMFIYQYALNGGGVAVGDINNDNLPDLYFGANQLPNKLYLNKGGLKFDDISEEAGVSGNNSWATGVTIVDVNGDGWNDIYVCHAGNFSNESGKLRNELFINNRDTTDTQKYPTFTEAAEQYGLGGNSRTTHTAFFDYDNDNDLDVYMVNHPVDFNLLIDNRLDKYKHLPDNETDRLYRNDGNIFTDVTNESGIKNWAFGLSASIGELNGDGWSDIYVGNDYTEKDFYYFNNQDGTFRHGEDSAFFHISNFSMGSDIADINNDLLPDLFVNDMMAEDNRRKKINMSAMKPAVFWENVSLGLHYQYMQNVLQLNNGNGTFSDVAELAGVSNTDWSWSAIFSDLDNDGWKDLVITNGLPVDIRNTDANKKLLGKSLSDLSTNYEKYLSTLPSEPIDNYFFKNNGDLTFSNKTAEWNLNYKGFSNGTIVSDLDRDGDLDVVMNNLNDNSIVFENKTTGANYIQFNPVGPPGNCAGIGVNVVLFSEDNKQVQELSLARGFQSGGENLIHFGLGKSTIVDSLYIKWPGGKIEKLYELAANKKYDINYHTAKLFNKKKSIQPRWFNDYTGQSGINFTHVDIPYDDFISEVLLPHKYSHEGPKMTSGDVNGDGLLDLIIGGSKGFPAQLYLQTKSKQFLFNNNQPWLEHSGYEDNGLLLFDADNDNDLDLYIASGSNEWKLNHEAYRDRLYKNDGYGNFEFSPSALPRLYISSSCVKAGDIDNDGDWDLFVGGRIIPGHYPSPTSSTILENRGGYFVDATAQWTNELQKMGLVTDATWTDINNDGLVDLCVVGEWMPITVYKNTGEKLMNITESALLSDKVGWWYSIHPLDFDNDGDTDFIAGNIGLNTKYKGNAEEPFEIYYHDFDANGKNDIVLSYYERGQAFPVRGRSCSSEQIPEIKEKFPNYNAFGDATLKDVYGDSLKKALNYQANWMATSIIENLGDGTFKVRALPNEAQFSAVNSILSKDVNKDGIIDLILAGNKHQAEVETCRHDASIGLVLTGDGKGNFSPIPYTVSGFAALGDVRDIEVVDGLVVISKNNGALQVCKIN